MQGLAGTLTSYFDKNQYGEQRHHNALDDWDEADGEDSLIQEKVVGVTDLEEGFGFSLKRLCPGDVIIRVGPEGPQALHAPFPKGLQDIYAEINRIGQESIPICVLRGRDKVDISVEVRPSLFAAIAPRVIGAVLSDGSEAFFKGLFEESLDVRDSLKKRMAEKEITRLGDMCANMAIAHEAIYDTSSSSKGEEWSPPPEDSDIPSLYTVLVYPRHTTRDVTDGLMTWAAVKYKDFSHTSGRALAWLAEVKKAGVRLKFHAVQSEILPGTLRREGGNSMRYEEKVHQAAMRGRWEAQMGDMNFWVYRAARLFFEAEREQHIQLETREGETSYGISLSRDQRGLVCIVGVLPGGAAARVGLLEIVDKAKEAGQRVAVLRLQGVPLTPSVLSDSGAIYCTKLPNIMQTMGAFARLQKPLWMTITA